MPTNLSGGRLHVCRSDELYDERARGLLSRDWTSVLFSVLPYPRSGSWIARDVRRGLPFGDGEFGAAYANHVFEHLTTDEAKTFAAELRRVLAPGAVLRVSVPDLEVAARRYLEALDGSSSRRHEWAVVALLDQMVRTRPGGRLLDELRADDADELREQLGPAGAWVSGASRRRGPFRSTLAHGLVRRVKRAALRGDPRKTLEAHRWMWDRRSLPRLLVDAGFVDCERTTAERSRIPGWDEYDLDRLASGAYLLEPSLYVEALRP